jgi:hypothetical protein
MATHGLCELVHAGALLCSTICSQEVTRQHLIAVHMTEKLTNDS